MSQEVSKLDVGREYRAGVVQEALLVLTLNMLIEPGIEAVDSLGDVLLVDVYPVDGRDDFERVGVLFGRLWAIAHLSFENGNQKVAVSTSWFKKGSQWVFKLADWNEV